MAGKGKVAIAGLIAVLVVAMVVAAVVIVGKNKSEAKVNSSNKAAEGLCANTDYKETCRESLSKSNSSDPKKLVQAALDYSVERVSFVIKESDTYKQAAQDKSTKDALDVCEEVLNTAVDDLKRSFETVGNVNSTSDDKVLEDLRAWLSAVGTYQQTCLDAFDKASNQTESRMHELLKTSKELSSNGLAMLDQIKKLFKGLDIDSFQPGRKLVSEEDVKHSEEAKGDGSDPDRRGLYDFNSVPAGEAPINTVVSQDGTGQYKTINEALKVVPPSNVAPYVIFVKAGVYAEDIIIPKYMNKVVLLGDGPRKTIITGKKNTADGIKTYNTATVAINADNFLAKDIAFENTAGPAKQQAVALRVSGDRAVFFNVHINGFKNTLFTHTYRQFYRDCTISGTLDFVFGDALAIFQNCNFVIRKPLDNVLPCVVAAQGRIDPRSLGAIVIDGGRIMGAPEFLATHPEPKAFLGRPWRALSRTIIMQTTIDALISPEGWTPMIGNLGQDTCYFAEYKNKGPGSDVTKRVQWKGVVRLDAAGAETWTPARAFGADDWIIGASIPYEPKMMI